MWRIICDISTKDRLTFIFACSTGTAMHVRVPHTTTDMSCALFTYLLESEETQDADS